MIENINISNLKMMVKKSLSLAQKNLIDAFQKKYHQKKKGYIYSPLSILFSLIPLLQGTSGDVLDELVTFLLGDRSSPEMVKKVIRHLKTLKDDLNDSTVIKIENFMIANTEFQHSFMREMKTMVHIYEPYNLQNVNKINTKIEKLSRGKFTQILKYEKSTKTDPECLFEFINLVVFKTHWKTQFLEEDTKKKDFYLQKDETIPIKMMHQYDKKHYYYQNESYQLAEMLYDDEDYAFGVVLPKDTFEVPILKIKNLYRSIEELEEIKFEVLAIPRFKQRVTLDLIKFFQSVGVKSMFSGTKKDGFNKMFDDEYAGITNFEHKALIIVNEKGTEAQGLTLMRCIPMAKKPRATINFIANRPFHYYIRHLPSGVLLFVGIFKGKK